MATKFPPSSPTRWDQPREIGQKNGFTPSDQLTFLSDDYVLETNNTANKQKNNGNLYPTPNPSSSTGVAIPSSPILSALDDHINNKEDSQGQFSFDSSFTKDIIEPPIAETVATNNNGNSKDDMIPILINPSLSQHLILGRKMSVCDIQLPSLKNISRQHAIVTYNDHTNLVNITCLGTNGMVILFHSDRDFFLNKLSPRDNLTSYKISPCASPKNQEGKLLQRQNQLISFALLKNESIELPLINNTILDFRQCRSVIHVILPTSQDVDNDTETEDEMTLMSTKSDDFVHTPTKRLIPISTHSGNSPITEEVSMINQRSSPSKIVTPITLSSKQEEPHTPKKLKQDSIANSINNYNSIRLNNMESPIVRESNNEFEHRILQFRPLKQGLIKRTISKLETDLLSKSIKMPKTPLKNMKSEKKPKENVTVNPTIVKKEPISPVIHTALNSDNTKKDTPITKKSKQPNSKSTFNIQEKEEVSDSKITIKEPIKSISQIIKEEKVVDKLTDNPKEGTIIHKTKNKRCAPSTTLNSNKPLNRIKQTPRLKKKRTIQKKYNEKDILQDLEKRDVQYSEIQRIIINNLAYSNLQQTPLSQLREINNQTKALTKIEIKSIIHEASCIGEIKRQGKDAAGKLLEEEYYYDLENDHDEERRNLIITLRGGRNSGLRACRRTHKQYYWKKPPKK